MYYVCTISAPKHIILYVCQKLWVPVTFVSCILGLCNMCYAWHFQQNDLYFVAFDPRKCPYIHKCNFSPVRWHHIIACDLIYSITSSGLKVAIWGLKNTSPNLYFVTCTWVLVHCSSRLHFASRKHDGRMLMCVGLQIPPKTWWLQTQLSLLQTHPSLRYTYVWNIEYWKYSTAACMCDYIICSHCHSQCHSPHAQILTFTCPREGLVISTEVLTQ